MVLPDGGQAPEDDQQEIIHLFDIAGERPAGSALRCCDNPVNLTISTFSAFEVYRNFSVLN